MIRPRRPQSPSDVRRHYDELDAFYREVWGNHVHHGLWLQGDEAPDNAVRQLVLYALEDIRLDARSRVCDVGCGYGATASLIAMRFGAEVTGITLSPRQFEFALTNVAADRCRFLHGNWMENSLDSGQFDLVLAIESLSHMPDMARFFAEACRVLRPGGRLVVLAWLAGTSVGGLQRRVLLEPICTEGRLPGLATAEEVRRFARREGFHAPAAEFLDRRVRRTWTVCLRRLVSKVVTDSRYRRYLIDSHSTDRRFLLTILRIMAAYRTGAMRYGLFRMLKPE